MEPSAVRWMQLLVWIWLFTSKVLSQSFTLRQDFQSKLMDAKQNLRNSFHQSISEKLGMSMALDEKWTNTFDEFSSETGSYVTTTTAMRTGNQTTVLLGQDMWILHQDNISLVTTLPEIIPSNLKFVRSTEWRENMFLLLCYNNKCDLLYSTTRKFNFSYVQSISEPSGIPIDAEFFVQEGSLYLFVLYQAPSSTVSQIRLYRWLRTSLDREKIPEITSYASYITVFTYSDHAVLVVSCSGDEKIRSPSQVWCRESSGKIVKMHYLPTSKHQPAVHFVERGYHFILAFEEDQAATIYWWRGNEFVKWMSVDEPLAYFNVFVSSNIRNTTYLLFTKGASLKIYSMTYSTLQQIYETNFLEGIPSEVIKISSVTMYEDNGKIYVFVISKAQDNEYLSLYEVTINKSSQATDKPSMKGSHNGTYLETVENIFNSMLRLKNQTISLEPVLPAILLTNKEMNISNVVSVLKSVEVHNGLLKKVHKSTNLQQQSTKANTLKKTMDKLNSCLPSQVQINRRKEYLKDLYLKEARIKLLNVKTLNRKPFEPESLLSLSNGKNRFKSLKVRTLNTDWLLVHNIGIKSVKDLLLDGSIISVPVRTTHLESHNLQIEEEATINDICAKKLMNDSVTVETGDEVSKTISKVAEPGREQILGSKLHLQDNTTIENLNVDYIGNTSVKDLFNSLFTIYTNNSVYGNLYFEHGLRTHILKSKKSIQYSEEVHFNPDVSNSTWLNQNMNSNLNQDVHYYPNYPGMHPPRIRYLPPNTYPWLYPPQTNHSIGYQLPINPNTHFLFPYPGMRQRRYIEDRRNPVTTIKTKIKIIGNLKVDRLVFKKGLLRIGNNSVPTSNIDKIFWTHSTPQVIHKPVSFSQGVTVLTGLSSLVNGKNLSQYVSLHSGHHSLVLENIYVDGDISAVFGSFPFQISSLKYLQVNHLFAGSINDKNTKYILHEDHLLHKDLEIITGNLLVEGNMKADLVNSIDVNNKFETTIFTDVDVVLPEVVFKSISTRSAEVEHINNHKAEQLLALEHLGQNSIVHIKGDLHTNQLWDVSSINNKPVNLSLVVNNSRDTIVYGKKRFSSQISIQGKLSVNKMNNIKFEDMFDDFLRTSTDQEVAGFYYIRNVSMKSLSKVSEINGISTSVLVYIDGPIVNVPHDIHFTSFSIGENLTVNSLHDNCILPMINDNELEFIRGHNWSLVEVTGACNWPKTGGKRLQHLLDSAVTSTANQTIGGTVTFNHLSSNSVVVNSFNDRNITSLFQDTFSRGNKTQVFTGKKNFVRALKCDTVEVKGNVTIKTVNGMDVSNFDSKLVRHTDDGNIKTKPISGRKTFLSGFKAFVFNCSGGINSIPAKSLATDNNRRVIPPLVVSSLVVKENVNVETINTVNINRFLTECIYTNLSHSQLVTGHLHFSGDIALDGNVTSSNINNISNSELVFMSDNQNPANIRGCKIFVDNIYIETDLSVETLNNKSFSEAYEQSVKTYQNITLNGDLIILSEIELNNVHANEYFVNERKLINLNKTTVP